MSERGLDDPQMEKIRLVKNREVDDEESEEERSRGFKFLILGLLCTVTFGSYFCFDAPSALEDDFKRDLEISTATFTAFYSWYNWPNIILCFFGGLLIDRVFGVRVGTVLFATLVLIGNIVFAAGAFANNVALMNLGRFIFGFVKVTFLLVFDLLGILNQFKYV